MVNFFRPFKKKKDEFFLALDVGTETVKTLIFKKVGQKIVILGVSLQYFDQFSVFNSGDFEADILKKTILKAIEEAESKINKKSEFILIGLPANILKGRVIGQFLIREKPKEIINKKEEEKIFEEIFRKAQKEISQKFATDFNVLPRDFHFLSQKVLEIKIDGYPVPNLLGYEGKKLDFKILTTFLSKYYLENFKKIAEKLKSKVLKMTHPAQGLLPYFSEKPSGIFLDVGGEVSQIFLVKEGKLEQIAELEIGGRAFSQSLSQTLGLEEGRARALKARYSKGLLSEGVRKRMKEIFLGATQNWFKNFKDKLRETKSSLPSTIFLFGGGSLLPEIEEVLTEGNWEGLPFLGQPEVKFIYPKDLKNVEDKTKTLNSPQEVPLLLLCHYAQKDF